MLNVGFIGCGGIAHHHAQRFAELKNARITAVADICEEAARSFAADFGADAWFTDSRKMLAQGNVDAVWICTPTFLHAKHTCEVARAGKHVFCEKPMAMKVGDACRAAEACKKAGVLLTIGFVRRFDAQWGKFKEIVQSGVVGRPVIWRFAAGGKPPKAWFRDEKKGGGPLMDGAVHNYDFARQLFGEVVSVQASSLQFDDTSIGADSASAILNFESGDQHSLIWSWGVAKGAQVTSLNDIIGPTGSLQFGLTATKTPAKFDPEKEEFKESDANAMLKREYREGFEVPQLA